MKSVVRAAFGALLLCAPVIVFAQQAPVAMASQPVALVVGAPAVPMLRTGQEMSLRTLIEMTTLKKGLTVGQHVPLEVAEAVTLNGQVVIPVGTPAMGEISMVRNKGMWGKSGAFAGRVLYIRVGDRQIRMSGTFDDKGHAGGGAAVATSALVFLPAGFFMTGTSAKLASGTPVKGFLDEDVPVQMAAVAAPAPLQAVAVSTPVVASASPIAPVTNPAPAMTNTSAPAKPANAPSAIQPAVLTKS